jgi:septum formation protein
MSVTETITTSRDTTPVVPSPIIDQPRLILASASPARLQTLLDAGLSPEVVVSHLDEDAYSAADVVGLVSLLAKAKGQAVFDALGDTDQDVLVVACDSLLELEGEPMGKPDSPTQAIERWRRMRGRTARLHTGHQVIARLGATVDSTSAVATTEVVFANIDDAEIEAYVATGEPLRVAGAFTTDGLGGAYVTTMCGDPHNVVGISLPLLRRMFAELGVPWHTMWRGAGSSI